jgi:DNA repair protein RecN (Recombination protein N)
VHYDAEKVQQLQDRIDDINRLLHKHRFLKIEELISFSELLQKKISGIESSGERIEMLKKEKDQVFSEVRSLAEQLSSSRKKVIPVAEKKISRLLAELKMPDAVFKIMQLFNLQNISSSGADEIQFLFSANKGIAPMQIEKVASGGELSRLMLSIKSSVAKQMELPTMIFDEIDAGVSGEVALKVGSAMKDMASGHQLIAITHLPQIASRADAHFIVIKKLHSGKTISAIELLSEEEHTLEIAKMIAGGKPSAAAIQNAKELIG